MNQFKQDWEQFNELSPALQAGEVFYLEDTSEIFKGIVSQFPVPVNRIDWNSIPNVFVIRESGNQRSASEITQFVRAVFEELHFSEDEWVWVVFDGCTEGGIKIKTRTLIEMAHTFFTIAQHTYVVPEDFGWCINHSFERQLHFCFATIVEGSLEAICTRLEDQGIPARLRTIDGK